MYPTLFRLGPITLHSYGLMMALGFLSAIWVWKRLSRCNGYSAEFRSSLLLWVLIGGLVGARLFHVIEYWQDFVNRPWAILRLDQGGLVFYGGAIGAWIGLVMLARRNGKPAFELMDLVATALPLGHAWGRLGCLLNGCCHGRPSGASACGIRFPHDSLAWQAQIDQGLIGPGALSSLPVFPTQWIEIVGNGLLFVLLYRLYPRRRFRGAVSGLYLMLYPILRFSVEPLRGDPRFSLGALSIGQVVSLGLFVLGSLVLIVGWRTQPIRRSTATES